MTRDEIAAVEAAAKAAEQPPGEGKFKKLKV